jgi:hypothetical protein
MQIDPRKWFKSAPQTLQTRPIPSLPVFQQTPKSNEVIPMSTAAVVPVVKHENGFERFIDKLKAFVKKEAPLADAVANAAKPILALTPFGPEYNLALTAIETAARADVATQAAAGKPLTGTQQMALAVQLANTGIATILESKGVTEPTAVQAAISQFLQNVYDLQTGPSAAVVPAQIAVAPVQ